MEIQILGNAAAISELPLNSSALVNDEFLIDCGPSVPAALRLYEKNPGNIRFIFISHYVY